MSQAVGQLHEALQLSIEGTHNLHASPLGRAGAFSDTSDPVPAGQAATASSCADAIGEKAERRSSGRMMAKRAERSMLMDVMMIRCVGKIQPVRPNVANEDVCGGRCDYVHMDLAKRIREEQ